MVSCSLTLIFYGTSFLLVTRRRSTVSARLLAVGALPAIWISICAVAGLLDTCLGLSPLIVLASVVVGLVVYTARTPRATVAPQRLHLGWYGWTALGISGAFALAVAAHAHWVEPWGGWDTLFTWVMRARFFSIGGSQWHNAFSNDLALLHPDYPPMLSWALHALWRVDGQNSSFAVITLFDPVCLAFVFFILGFQSISTERLQLDFPTAALLAMPILWKLAAAILADFALSYAILGSCAFYAFSISKQDPRAAFAASFLAAWSGLIKNEGMVWCIAFLAVAISASLMSRNSVRRRIVWTLVAGAAIPLFTLITFKLTLAPPSDLVDPSRTSEISDIVQPGILINPERLIIRLDQVELFLYHRVILHNVWQVLFDWRDWGVALWLCLFLFAKRFRRPGPSAHLLTAIGIQLAMYYGVYLITPYLVWWHISNSLSRILVHIVPGALCLLAFDTNPRTAAIQRSNQTNALQKPLPRRARGDLSHCRIGVQSDRVTSRALEPRQTSPREY